jgi:hypothetical protein
MEKRIFSLIFLGLFLTAPSAFANVVQTPLTPEREARRDLTFTFTDQLMNQNSNRGPQWIQNLSRLRKNRFHLKPRWRPFAKEAILRYESKLNPQFIYQYDTKSFALLLTYLF